MCSTCQWGDGASIARCAQLGGGGEAGVPRHCACAGGVTPADNTRVCGHIWNQRMWSRMTILYLLFHISLFYVKYVYNLHRDMTYLYRCILYIFCVNQEQFVIAISSLLKAMYSVNRNTGIQKNRDCHHGSSVTVSVVYVIFFFGSVLQRHFEWMDIFKNLLDHKRLKKIT